MMVLVTGANGLLATNTIITLLARGYKVKGLIRDTSKFLLAPHANLELVVGDITDPVSLASAISGCDYIIHCAATTDEANFWMHRPRIYARVVVGAFRIALCTVASLTPGLTAPLCSNP